MASAIYEQRRLPVDVVDVEKILNESYVGSVVYIIFIVCFFLFLYSNVHAFDSPWFSYGLPVQIFNNKIEMWSTYYGMLIFVCAERIFFNWSKLCIHFGEDVKLNYVVSTHNLYIFTCNHTLQFISLFVRIFISCIRVDFFLIMILGDIFAAIIYVIYDKYAKEKIRKFSSSTVFTYGLAIHMTMAMTFIVVLVYILL